MITVIIPTLWKINRLYETLTELEKCESVDQIILIDNTGIKKNISNKKLTYVLEKENTYVNPAWNKGISLSRNDKICVLNDDVWFDWKKFKEIEPMISPEIGLIGMSPNNYNTPFDENLSFVKIIADWKTSKGHRPIGYGCCFFIHKKNWKPIPNKIKVWAGDDYLFYYRNNLSNYMIEGLKCNGHISYTCNSLENIDEISKNDMLAIKDLIRDGIIENYLIGTIWQ